MGPRFVLYFRVSKIQKNRKYSKCSQSAPLCRAQKPQISQASQHLDYIDEPFKLLRSARATCYAIFTSGLQK